MNEHEPSTTSEQCPVADGTAVQDGNQAWAVSIEVDSRQKYLFETDKLQEMVGASAIMRELASVAENIACREVHVIQPPAVKCVRGRPYVRAC